MTDFVETFATQQLLPPWQAKGARISGFVIRLRPERIQSYLDKYFNAAYPDYAPFRYEPLPLDQQYGLLTASTYPVIRTTTRHPASGGEIWDNISHTEIYLAFPVYRRTVNADGLLSQPTLVWVQPAVYSDNDTVVFSSREIWGTDMFLATIEQDPSTPAFHLDAGLVAIKHFDPRSVDKLLAFLHIHATPAPALDLPAVLQANPSLQEFVNILGAAGMFSGDSPPPGVQKGAYPAGVELNNLKQFRDCYDMGVAIYRAIVASQSSYTNVGDIVFYDTPGIDIAFMWSDGLAEFLQSILGADKPSMDTAGPPPVHAEDWTSQLDWDMGRVVVKADLGFAFVGDVDFRVLSTIHTYGTTA